MPLSWLARVYIVPATWKLGEILAVSKSIEISLTEVCVLQFTLQTGHHLPVQSYWLLFLKVKKWTPNYVDDLLL